jgi:RNA polymerase sigma-70 factor (ECF subfamily)
MTDPGNPHVPDELVQRALAGDLPALRDLLAYSLPELTVYVRLIAGADVLARESVSDITQSVAGDVLPALAGQRFDDLRGFFAYVRRAALHKLIDKQRHHRAARRDLRREVDDAGTPDSFDLPSHLRDLLTPSGHAIAAEDAAMLADALQRLPDDQREVVTLARLAGLPHAEIAQLLGRTAGACRMLLSRGMRALARELEGMGG